LFINMHTSGSNEFCVNLQKDDNESLCRAEARGMSEGISACDVIKTRGGVDGCRDIVSTVRALRSNDPGACGKNRMCKMLASPETACNEEMKQEFRKAYCTARGESGFEKSEEGMSAAARAISRLEYLTLLLENWKLGSENSKLEEITQSLYIVKSAYSQLITTIRARVEDKRVGPPKGEPAES